MAPLDLFDTLWLWKPDFDPIVKRWGNGEWKIDALQNSSHLSDETAVLLKVLK